MLVSHLILIFLIILFLNKGFKKPFLSLKEKSYLGYVLKYLLLILSRNINKRASLLLNIFMCQK